MTDRLASRYLALFRTIPKDVWHEVETFAPNNPWTFVECLRMLPDGCWEIKGGEFKIIGKL